MTEKQQQKSKAKVVDTLKLQALHPDRMEIAVRKANKYYKGYHTINLVKTWDDWFVYGLDMDDEPMHYYVMVDSRHEVRTGRLYTSRGMHFTNMEISAWRGEVLAELLRIQKEAPNVSNEQIAAEFIALTDKHVADLLSEGPYDIIENARQYAFIVTM